MMGSSATLGSESAGALADGFPGVSVGMRTGPMVPVAVRDGLSCGMRLAVALGGTWVAVFVRLGIVVASGVGISVAVFVRLGIVVASGVGVSVGVLVALGVLLRVEVTVAVPVGR